MRKALRALAIDLVALAGLGLFVAGLGLAWRPLAFIAGGLALVAVAYVLDARQPGGAR